MEGTENTVRPGTWDFPCLYFRTLSDEEKPYDKKAGVSLWLLGVPSGGPELAGVVVGNA
jgi:hypothetical protein